MTTQPNFGEATRSRRDDGTSVIAIYFFLVAGIFLLGTLILMFPTILLAVIGATEARGAFIGMAAVGLVALASLALSLLHLVVGYGLWVLRQWARIGAIALGIVGLMAMPIGTIAGVFILWHLLKPEVAARFEQFADV